MSDLSEVYAIINLEDDAGALLSAVFRRSSCLACSVHADTDPTSGQLDRLAWSDDGQLLTVSLQNGTVYTYLTKLPMVAQSNGSRMAYLTSLQEMTVRDTCPHAAAHCGITGVEPP